MKRRKKNKHSPLKYDFSVIKKLREQMKNKGKHFSREDFARKIDIKTKTLEKIEQGKVNDPRVLTIKKICDGLEMTIDQFFKKASKSD